MPRTIRNYAIDYNNNNTIELKNIEDIENELEEMEAILEKSKSTIH